MANDVITLDQLRERLNIFTIEVVRRKQELDAAREQYKDAQDKYDAAAGSLLRLRSEFDERVDLGQPRAP